MKVICFICLHLVSLVVGERVPLLTLKDLFSQNQPVFRSVVKIKLMLKSWRPLFFSAQNFLWCSDWRIAWLAGRSALWSFLMHGLRSIWSDKLNNLEHVRSRAAGNASKRPSCLRWDSCDTPLSCLRLKPVALFDLRDLQIISDLVHREAKQTLSLPALKELSSSFSVRIQMVWYSSRVSYSFHYFRFIVQFGWRRRSEQSLLHHSLVRAQITWNTSKAASKVREHTITVMMRDTELVCKDGFTDTGKHVTFCLSLQL